MTTEIYYFSGTGNSLHVAKELQKRIPGIHLIPMVSLLDKDVIETSADTVGFVFPTYLTTLPAPVRQFLDKLNLKSAGYIFSVVTRIGTVSVANVNLKKILKKKGKNLDSRFFLNMANNSPTGLKPIKGDKNWIHQINEKKVSQLESVVLSRLDSIATIITAQEKYPQKAFLNPFMYLLERIMYLLTYNNKTQIDFYADSTCTGCMICEQVCLSKKIAMHNERPEWQKDIRCYYCYACFNFCPTQSILVKNKYTQKDGRYFHPDVTAKEIQKEKEKSSS